MTNMSSISARTASDTERARWQPRSIENRMAFLVSPKAPFIQWLNRIDPALSGALTLDMLRDEPNVFLVPACAGETDVGGRRWLSRHWRVLLERILVEWQMDRADWPSFASVEVFCEWFDVKSHPSILDCCVEPIAYEHGVDA